MSVRAQILRCFLFLSSFVFAQDSVNYLVRIDPSYDIDNLIEYGLNAKAAYVISSQKHASFLQSFISVQTSDESSLEELRKSGLILYWEAARKQIFHYTPSDSFFNEQWHLDKIKAPDGWNLSQGDTNYVVAIVDSGVDYLHDDLKDNLAYNYADPINGLDDDEDGYLDNFYGWDFGDDDHDPIVDSNGPVQSHGSSICGVAAATTDNDLGTASPAFRCRYLPVKITNTSGMIVDTNAGILYAAQMGAKVINCSFGTYEYSQAEQDIIAYVTDSMDVLVVASAGNDNSNEAVYPASLNQVIGVSAVNENDQKIAISNYGNHIDIAAPGASIYGPLIWNQYSYKSGTSVAAALVSSAAILLRSYFLLESAYEIKERLLYSADAIDVLNPYYQGMLGLGRLNLKAAFDHEMSDVEHIMQKKIVQVFPNPTSESIMFSMQMQIGAYQLFIHSILGTLVYFEDFYVDSPSINKSLCLNHLNDGKYSVTILGKNFKHTSGFVIAR